MEFSDIDFLQLIKNMLMFMSICGIAVDITPWVKFQPIRFLFKKLGNLINQDITEQLNSIQADFVEHKIEGMRYEILDFANSCMNGRKHSKEEFDHIIEQHDKYIDYLKKHNQVNGKVDLAYSYITEIYKNCLQKNSFLSAEKRKENNNEN